MDPSTAPTPPVTPVIVPVPVAAPPAPAPAVSPTGVALVSPKLTPYLFAAFTIATALAGAGQIPGVNLPPAVSGDAALVAILLAGLLGITPGLRGKTGG